MPQWQEAMSHHKTNKQKQKNKEMRLGLICTFYFIKHFAVDSLEYNTNTIMSNIERLEHKKTL